MSDPLPHPALRPPLVRAAPPVPWIDAFYVEHRHDEAVNAPYMKPMSPRRAGPYSTYDAAVTAGEQMECSDFAVERRRVNPRRKRPVFLDVAEQLADESRDTTLPDPDDDAADFTL